VAVSLLALLAVEVFCVPFRINSKDTFGMVLFAGGAGADFIKELSVLLCDMRESLRFGSSPSLSEGREVTEFIVRMDRVEKVGDAGELVVDGG
jgi:hypothetical protein